MHNLIYQRHYQPLSSLLASRFNMRHFVAGSQFLGFVPCSAMLYLRPNIPQAVAFAAHRVLTCEA